MTAFQRFLLAHREERTALGDLARDAEADAGFPWGEDERGQADHLRSVNAHPDALSTLRKAWRAFRA